MLNPVKILFSFPFLIDHVSVGQFTFLQIKFDVVYCGVELSCVSILLHIP